jgi:hypothetical protein
MDGMAPHISKEEGSEQCYVAEKVATGLLRKVLF